MEGIIINLPNLLTIFRLILIPIFLIAFFSPSLNSLLYAVGIFLLAGVTDLLDGYIARKFNLITKVGIVLDPLADKLMLITVLTCLVIKSYIPIWMLIIIAGKEIFMIFCGLFLYKRGTVIPSNIFGKLGTILFYISILTLSLDKALGIYLLYISIAAALVAFFNYLIVYKAKSNNDDHNLKQ
ncbi:CDP-diacylglycerol--glycerol-3-phosphate 3-phosphatidyltransferase [Candidatus Clostridium radicumherbarum]|uniref:CDP-diacylglycerol--glycerol-3-phosphate 3-phosphatidyltransferase n=1 Tax=Candidatus Clostridium radicumherbarum TaxID=3381662 RepID=A0ABW8TW57_9CLOT